MKCLACFLFGHKQNLLLNNCLLPKKKQRGVGFVCERCFETVDLKKVGR